MFIDISQVFIEPFLNPKKGGITPPLIQKTSRSICPVSGRLRGLRPFQAAGRKGSPLEPEKMVDKRDVMGKIQGAGAKEALEVKGSAPVAGLEILNEVNDVARKEEGQKRFRGPEGDGLDKV